VLGHSNHEAALNRTIDRQKEIVEFATKLAEEHKMVHMAAHAFP